MEQIEVRRATEKDCDFLANIVVLAESTGCEIVSYEKMFSSISPAQLKRNLAVALRHSSEGHPLSYLSYFIACVNSIPAAAAAGYIEGENGDSNLLITGVLLTAFLKQDVIRAFSFLKNHADVHIPKTKNTVQIDCVATLPIYRGRGLFSRIHNAIIQYAKEKGITESEIQVWKKNTQAIRTYTKLGYVVSLEKISHSDPNNGKVLLKKYI